MKTFLHLTIVLLSILLVGTLVACKQAITDITSNIAVAEVQQPIEEFQSITVDLVTMAGKVKSINSDKSACFFVDPEMVKQQITPAIEKDANGEICIDPTFGKGVPIDFTELKQKDYPNLPEEDVLLSVQGQWRTITYKGKENVRVFYVKTYEPFF